jgi:hypothetical protein
MHCLPTTTCITMADTTPSSPKTSPLTHDSPPSSRVSSSSPSPHKVRADPTFPLYSIRRSCVVDECNVPSTASAPSSSSRPIYGLRAQPLLHLIDFLLTTMVCSLPYGQLLIGMFVVQLEWKLVLARFCA